MSSPALVQYLQRIAAITVLILVFMHVFVSPIHAAEGQNLIANGDFQLVRQDGTPEFWYVNVTLDHYQVLTADSLRVPGEKALRLVGTEPAGRAFVYYRLPVEEGQRYVLRFWHRTKGPIQPGTSPTRHEARVEFINAEQNKLIAPSLFFHLPMQVVSGPFRNTPLRCQKARRSMPTVSAYR